VARRAVNTSKIITSTADLDAASASRLYPAHQARLIGIGGHKVAPIVLSLNTSFMFLGFSAGAALGSIVLANGSVAELGWVGASFEIAALLLAFRTSRPLVTQPVAL
jgi:predicted MFS family arabinose efflux permease